MRTLLTTAAVVSVLTLAGCASSGGSDASARTDAAAAAGATSAVSAAEVAATGSASAQVSARLKAAIANLSAASASLVSGRLMLTPTSDGVQVTGTIGGLKPNGSHAFHIHEKGDCSAADASSAGGHFNPGAQPHGRITDPRHHAGDNDNLRANMEGVATVDTQFAGVTLGGSSVTDVVGKAIVVHADPDDYTTQPTGNAGARVACGVIAGE